MLQKGLSCLTGLLASVVLAGCSSLASLGDATDLLGNAPPRTDQAFHQPALQTAPRELTIGNDRGGYVATYALRMVRLRDNGTFLRFAGHCESACTLFLALPTNQTCIARGASFRFHAPLGPSRIANERALTYLLNTYPAWVKNWIASKGGLTPRVITLGYDQASQYMQSCESAVDT